ncbi:MAG: phytoene/squalene synthase family protein [Planctomycetes bacterium]|nr:phytoene/squalene synthase family protein [Planctomycetota bacterium]
MISLESSYRYALDVARSRAKTFYYTFRFLPPERRRGILAVYAFSRRADDAVDSIEEAGSSPEQARAELAFLRSLLGPGPPDDPLAPALQDTIRRFAIPLRPFEELLAGMEMDLVKRSYATFEELRTYCYRAASVVGLACIEVFGHTDPAARESAVDLGIAMQLVNVLRDVAEDLARGRIYLPEEDMARFGYSADDLRRGVVDDRFRDLMRFEAARAREHFRRADALYPLVLPESRYCPVLLMRFYWRILERIERQGFDVLTRRPSLRWHEKVRIAGRTWLEAITSRTT